MNKKIEILLKEISALFYSIRCDWEDPRIECRDGMAKVKELKELLENLNEA